MFVIAKKKRMRMNQQTKINFILEHIAHIDDLIKDNIDEALLSASLRDIKFLLEKQLQTIHERKGLMGNTKKWAIKVETLHTYIPSSHRIEKLNDPMWK